MKYKEDTWTFIFPLLINFVMSVGAYLLTVRLIPRVKDIFIKANLYGIDMNKSGSEKV